MSKNTSTEIEQFNAAEFVGTALFDATFAENAALVRKTSAYLEGEGRRDAHGLPRKIALAFAGESMRLTTRMMQISAWLLAQRARHNGKMTVAEAGDEKYRLGLDDTVMGSRLAGSEHLPPKLLDIIELSEQLYLRLSRIDGAMYGEPTETDSVKAVTAQLDRLKNAFAQATDAANDDF